MESKNIHKEIPFNTIITWLLWAQVLLKLPFLVYRIKQYWDIFHRNNSREEFIDLEKGLEMLHKKNN